MVRTVIITQKELLQSPKEVRCRQQLAQRLEQLHREYEEAVRDLLTGRHHERMEEMMKQLKEATAQAM